MLADEGVYVTERTPPVCVRATVHITVASPDQTLQGRFEPTVFKGKYGPEDDTTHEITSKKAVIQHPCMRSSA